MIPFLKSLFRRRSPVQENPERVLKGAPARVRVKTYSAETGHVYQYVYRGYRPVEAGQGFVFEVISTVRSEIEVRVTEAALAECARCIGREVLPQERYAIAKMALFEGFDSGGESGDLCPTGEAMDTYLRNLGRV